MAVCLISMSLEFVPEANGSDVSGMPSIAVEIQKQTTIKFLPGARCGSPMTTVRTNHAKINCELDRKNTIVSIDTKVGAPYIFSPEYPCQ